MSWTVDATRGAGAAAAAHVPDAATGFSTTSKALGNVGDHVGYITDAAAIAGAYATGGWERAKGAIGQITIDRFVDLAGSHGASVAAALLEVPEAPAVGMYYGGKAIGSVLNQTIRPCDDSSGRSLSLQDCITDNVWSPLLADQYYTFTKALDSWTRDMASMAEVNDAAALAAADAQFSGFGYPNAGIPIASTVAVPSPAIPAIVSAAAAPAPAPKQVIPAGWVACSCPDKHAHAGIMVKGTLYHPPNLKCG